MFIVGVVGLIIIYSHGIYVYRRIDNFYNEIDSYSYQELLIDLDKRLHFRV